MKIGFLKWLGTLLGVVCLFVDPLFGETIVPPGNVSGVWTAQNSPYIVGGGDIIVANGSGLVLLPGTRVEFEGHYRFIVNGHLRVVGTETDSVVITSTFVSSGNQGPGGWRGLRLVGADSTQFDYCVIDNGNAIFGSSQDSTGGGAFISGAGTHVVFRHSTFANNYSGSNGGGLFVTSGTSAGCYDCKFVGNRSAKDGGAAFVNNSSNSRFERCEFLGNRSGKEAGAIHSRFGAPVYLDCIFRYNVSFNSGGAVTASGQASFRRCIFEWNISEVSQGGGLYFYDSSTRATLDSCLIYRNRTLLRDGGGAYCWEAAPRFTDCQFVENESADDGGGVHCYRPGANPIFTRCVFERNTAADRGGGMKISRESFATVTDCQIRNNRSNGRGGGGVFCRLQAGPVFTNCVIENNSSAGTGGGICTIESNPRFQGCLIRGNVTDSLGGGVFAYSSDVDMTNCTVSENHALMHGGALSLRESSPDITACRLQDNFADSLGGAIYLANALPMFTNCLITGNRGEVMGGVAVVSSSSPTFLHCTMVANSSPYGNSFVISQSPGMILNSIISGNSSGNGSGNSPVGIGFVGGSIAWTIRNTLFYAIGSQSFVGAVPVGLGQLTSTNANGTICDGYGNMFGDPGFVGTGAEPYQLDTLSSLVKNAGSIAGLASDIIGEARPVPVGSLPDLGCYESEQSNVGRGLWGVMSGTLPTGSHRVYGDLVVPQGSELVINAGTELEFMGPYGILVYGVLTVDGNTADSVFMFADTIANPPRWRGIRFYGSESSASRLKFLSLSNASSSQIDSSGGGFGFFGGSSPEINASSVVNCTAVTEGGGIRVVSGSPILTECIFSRCRATSGGAIRVESDGNISFSQGLIANCTADIGGAVSAQNCQLTFAHVSLSDNGAEEGGALHVRNSIVELSYVTMSNNSSDIFGGAMYGSGSEFNCDSLRLVSNRSNNGGGLYLTNCMGEIVGIECLNNVASGSGGAARILGGSVLLKQGLFVGNIAVQFGGVLRMSSDSSRVERCTIIDNYANTGSAAYLEASSAVMSSCQITNNGPAVYFQASSAARILNCNFTRNSGVNFQYYLNNPGNGPASIGVLNSANHLEYSSDTYSNLFVDPMYADYDGENYSLSLSSPCMDAGSPGAACDPDLTYVEIGAFYTPYVVNPWTPQKLVISAQDTSVLILKWTPAKSTRLCDQSGLIFEVEKLDSLGVWQQIYLTQDTTCVLPLDAEVRQVTPLRVRSAVAP